MSFNMEIENFEFKDNYTTHQGNVLHIGHEFDVIIKLTDSEFWKSKPKPNLELFWYEASNIANGIAGDPKENEFTDMYAKYKTSSIMFKDVNEQLKRFNHGDTSIETFKITDRPGVPQYNDDLREFFAKEGDKDHKLRWLNIIVVVKLTDAKEVTKNAPIIRCVQVCQKIKVEKIELAKLKLGAAYTKKSILKDSNFLEQVEKARQIGDVDKLSEFLITSNENYTIIK